MSIAHSQTTTHSPSNSRCSWVDLLCRATRKSRGHAPEDWKNTGDYGSVADVTKSSGPDGLSARMLKSVAHSITPSVIRQSGCFPVLWKVSNIIPIPKTGDKSNPSNYKPISLLLTLSKILEKHVAHLLTSQIKDKSLISDSQWGFLSGRSTTSALLCVIDTWQRHLDSGTEMCSVFLDLQKAFDTVPHRNLLLVLKQMEFHPTLLKWICSYLTSRVQRVVVNGATSSEVHAVSASRITSRTIALPRLH